MPREQLPPQEKMIRELASPDHTFGFFREAVSRESGRFLDLNPIKRGTLYSSCKGGEEWVNKAFPDLYFLKETVPIGSNTIAGMTQSEFVIWNWATDPDAESSFNAEISYLGDSVSNPVYARSYIVRRDVYEAMPALTIASALTALLGAKITNGGINYTYATATFVGPGAASNPEIEFVIANGVIIGAIVTREGSGFDTTSTIEIVGDGTDAEAILLIQPAGAILTSQKKMELPEGDPMANEFVKILRVWELLPGPWIPFTRYDNDLGPIQGRRRAVLNTGQRGGVLSATARRNYEGRDGSSVVSLEIEENWSNGTGNDPNNPIYPVLFLDDYDRLGERRGAYQRTSQIVVRDGNEVGSFTRGAGKVNKRSYEPYQDNPFLLKRIDEAWYEVVINDERMSSEFGGGILAIGEISDAPGILQATGGYLQVSSRTVQKSPDEQTLINERLDPVETEWPILFGRHTDDQTGIVIDFSKQVIPAGTPYPGRSGYRGPFIEDNPYDRWKTIRIISAARLDTLPGPEAWWTTIPFNLPPTLLSIEAIWSDFVGKSAEATDDNISVEVHSGSGGGVIVTSRNGFRGKAKCIQARDYFYGSPPESAVPLPIKILGSSGTVVITATDSRTFLSGNDEQTGNIGSTTLEAHSFNGGRVGDNFSNQVREIDIREHLVGPNVQILNATHKSQAVHALGVSGGGRTRAVGALGTNSFMEVRIPQSTPSQIVSGQQLLIDVDVREWRGGMGIWVVDRFYVIVP